MRHFTIAILLTLSACASITKQEFLQDAQNAEKTAELSQKATLSGCDKIIQLNKFAALDSPTSNDWAKIMPIFGIDSKKSDIVDKLYSMDFSVLDKYSCEEIRQEKKNYCDKKYKVYKAGFGNDFCLEYLYEEVPTCYTFEEKHGYKECNFQHDGKSIAKTIAEKLRQSYHVSEEVEFLLSEFSASELIKANSTELGIYDGYCGHYCTDYNFKIGYCYSLCDTDTKTVTKLNAATILYDNCVYLLTGGINKIQKSVCACYAHQTYNKVSYKNVIYIYEKNELPQSKKTEFNQILKKCEQKIKQQKIKAEKDRYGETSRPKNTNNNVFIESIDNAAWATQQINKEINKMRNK